MKKIFQKKDSLSIKVERLICAYLTKNVCIFNKVQIQKDIGNVTYFLTKPVN